MSITEAITCLTHEDAEVIEPIPEEKVPEEPMTQERFDSMLEKISEMQEENQLLMDKIEDMGRLVEYLRFRESELAHSIEIMNKENYWRVKRDREIAKKQSEVKSSKRECDQLRKKVKKLEKRLDLLIGVKRREMRGDMLAIKTIPHFTRESIEEYCRKLGLREGDIVLFEDASGGGPQTANLLIEREIRAVIVDTPLSHLPVEELVRATIPVIDADVVDLQRIDEFAFINRKKFEKQFMDFMKEVRESARQKGEEELIEIVEKYQRDIER
jgi:predicted RNase H-like nuclease (RuvC/YqgF family)